MSVEIRGQTITCNQTKAESTCYWVLDVGWKYGGFMWGVKPGRHAELVKHPRSGNYGVVQKPD
eukprot:COSAG03_NODE_269_length_9603_cov_225.864927_11_plen_63_part_00